VGVAPDPEDTVEWLPAATEEPRAVERLTREESLKARRQLRLALETIRDTVAAATPSALEEYLNAE